MSEDMYDDMDLHDGLHADTEDAVRSILHAVFPDDARPCRADVLIQLLDEEISAMDDRGDVLDASEAIMRVVLKRTVGDAALMFAPQGNA